MRKQFTLVRWPGSATANEKPHMVLVTFETKFASVWGSGKFAMFFVLR